MKCTSFNRNVFHSTKPQIRGFCTKTKSKAFGSPLNFSTWAKNMTLPIKKAIAYVINFIPNVLNEIVIFLLISKNRKLFFRSMLIIVFVLTFSLVIFKIIELREAIHLLQLDLNDLKTQNNELIDQINLKKKSLIRFDNISTSSSNNTSFFHRHESSFWCITGALSYTGILILILFIQDTSLVDYYDLVAEFVKNSVEIKESALEMQTAVSTQVDETDKLQWAIENFYTNSENFHIYAKDKLFMLQNDLIETNHDLRKLGKLLDSIDKAAQK